MTDIMRDTFEKDGHHDLIEMLDNNDTRVVQLFINYGIAFPEETYILLNTEMAIKFEEDTDKITNKYTSFGKIANKMTQKFYNQEAECDFDILAS